MHLGLTPWRPTKGDALSLVEQALFAEQLGYQSFWLPENHFNDSAIPDPLMLLAAVASATRNIKLATSSYLLPLRHPLQAAEQVAVLDQLSGGRVILGVGRGVGANMLRAFNVQPHQKRRQFERNLNIMIKAWSGQAILTSSATDPDLDSKVVLHPLPVQQPHPEIWVAAFGPKALAQAGRLGLPYLASPIETLGGLKRNFNLHSQECQIAGKATPLIRPVMRTVHVSNDSKVVANLRALFNKHMNNQNETSTWRDRRAALDDWAIIGNEQFARQKIAEYQQTLGMTHLIVTRLRVGNPLEEEQRMSLALLADIVADNASRC